LEETIFARTIQQRPIYTRNLHYLHKRAIEFKQNEDIIITDTDKNLGPIVLPTNEYRRLCLEHLSDRTTYNKIPWLEAYTTHATATRKFHFILRHGNHEQELLRHVNIHEWLLHHLDQPHQFPRFRVIPKPHKAGPLKSRPISGAINWVTTAPSIAAAHLLTPALTDAYKHNVIKNSQQMIRELEGMEIPTDSTLFSFDVISLYTNMQLNSIRDILHTALDNDEEASLLSPLGIALALECLQHSVIKFENEYFQQTSGMPMGTNVAVVLANLYLYFGIDKGDFIQSMLRQDIFRTWKRYIDDSFGILIHANNIGITFNDIRTFLDTTLPGIKWTYETSNTCLAFLDLFIHKEPISATTSRIRFTTHQKILNKYLYLPSPSSHAPALQRGFVTGELIRYVRNSTNETDFQQIRDKFRLRLTRRGYSSQWIDTVFRHVKYASRHVFLQDNERRDRNILPFIIRYNLRLTRMQIPRQIHYNFDLDVASVFPDQHSLRPLVSFTSNFPLRGYLYRNLTSVKDENLQDSFSEPSPRVSPHTSDSDSDSEYHRPNKRARFEDYLRVNDPWRPPNHV
jgi:hypothetical protein